MVGGLEKVKSSCVEYLQCPRCAGYPLEIYVEQYNLNIAVEAKTTIEVANTIIYPSAVRYQTELADSCLKMKELGLDYEDSVLTTTANLIKELKAATKNLEALLAHEEENALAEAKANCSKVLPAMLKVRAAADALEAVVADDLWVLPTYQEMLFIK